MGVMQAQLNLYRRGPLVSVAETPFIAHAHHMLALGSANACYGLIFQNHSLWLLKLAFQVRSAFQNGIICPKRSSSDKVTAIFALRTEGAVNAL